jgi:hypothetical protein
MKKKMPQAVLVDPDVKSSGMTTLRHIGLRNPKSVTLRIHHVNTCFSFDRPGNTCIVSDPKAVEILLAMTYAIDKTSYPMFEKVEGFADGET